MIWWIVDHANSVYFIFGLIWLGLGVAAWQTRRTKFLVWLGAFVVIGLLFGLLCHFIITDRKQVRINIHEMAMATLRHDAAKLNSYLSPEFEFQGIRQKDIATKVVGATRAYGVSDFQIWDFEVDELSRDRGTARVTFRLRVDIKGEQSHMMLCRGTYVLDGNRWYLRTFHVYNPVANTDQPLHVPLP